MTFHSRQIEDELAALSADLAERSLAARLRRIRDVIPGRLVFTTSFGLEDQALTHAIAESGVDVAFTTLDTGRLFDETLEVWAETEMRYGLSIQAFGPDEAAVRALIAADGPLGMRLSPEARRACCGVRKVAPLGRALAGASGWLTGLRADQSATRADTSFANFDPAYRLAKLSPLADWSRPGIEIYVRENAVPYNALHDRGFLSIGCAPCTRAVRVGETERAGRWWWESETKKECGLHNRPGFAPAPQPALA